MPEECNLFGQHATRLRRRPFRVTLTAHEAQQYRRIAARARDRFLAGRDVLVRLSGPRTVILIGDDDEMRRVARQRAYVLQWRVRVHDLEHRRTFRRTAVL